MDKRALRNFLQGFVVTGALALTTIAGTWQVLDMVEAYVRLTLTAQQCVSPAKYSEPSATP